MNELVRHHEFEGEQLLISAREAAQYFYMPKTDRAYLVESGASVLDQERIKEIVATAKVATETKLNGIGMNIPLYKETLDLLRDCDSEWLAEIAKYTREYTQGVALSVQTTKSQYEINGEYAPDRKALHDQIIREKFLGLTPAESPRIVFILGVPGSGKSEAVEDFIETEENFMLSDLDSLRHRLLPGYDGAKLEHILATQDEMVDIAYKALDIAFANNINVLCETTLRGEDWLKYMLDSASDYKKEFILIHSPLEECFKRAVAYRDRPVSLDFLLRAFNDGYANLFRVAAASPDFDLKIVSNKGVTFSDAKLIYQRQSGITEVKSPDDVAEILSTMNKLKEVR